MCQFLLQGGADVNKQDSVSQMLATNKLTLCLSKHSMERSVSIMNISLLMVFDYHLKSGHNKLGDCMEYMTNSAEELSTVSNGSVRC